MTTLRIETNKDLVHQGWDEFVTHSTSGHYTQSSDWAVLKHTQGWDVLRVIMYRNEKILGGAQILTGKKKGIRVAYLSKGPVIDCTERDAQHTLLHAIIDVIKQEKVWVYASQPPDHCFVMADLMEECGYFKLPYDNISPPGTATLDLGQSEEEMLRNFDRPKRRKIRSSQHNGLDVHRGTRDDIMDAYRVLSSTAERKDFSMPPVNYFYDAWDTMAPNNQVAFFISRYEGIPLSTLFVLPFGETVTLWRSGWNRQHGELYPNEAVYWAAILWAKANGYQRLDFGGLHINTARAILNDANTSRKDFPGYDVFKLEFNGTVLLHPESYLYFPPPLFRFVYRLSQPVIPALMDSRFMQNILARLSRGNA